MGRLSARAAIVVRMRFHDAKASACEFTVKRGKKSETTKKFFGEPQLADHGTAISTFGTAINTLEPQKNIFLRDSTFGTAIDNPKVRQKTRLLC